MAKTRRLFSLFRTRMTVRYLTILAIFVIIPIFLFIRVTKYNIGNELEKKAKADTNGLVNVMASNLLDRIDSTKHTLEVMSNTNQVSQMSSVSARQFLTRTAKESDNIWAYFYIANKKGEVVAHSKQDGKAERNVKDMEFFKKALETKQSFVTEPSYSELAGEGTVAIATPITKSGIIDGVLVGHVKLDYLTDIFNKQKVTESSYMLMLNSDGTIVVHPDKNLLFVNWLKGESTDAVSQASQTQESSTEATEGETDAVSHATQYESSTEVVEEHKALLEEMVQGKEGHQHTVVDGEKTLYIYKPLGFNTMSIATVVPEKEIFTLLDYFNRFMTVGAIVLCLVILGVLERILKSILKPVFTMKDTVEKISNGDLTVRTEIDREDEIGILAKAVDTMADNLSSYIDKVDNACNIIEDTIISFTSMSKQTELTVGEVAHAVEDIAQSTMEQAREIKSSVVKANELGYSVDHITESIERLVSITQEALSVNEMGIATIKELLEKTEETNKYTKEISNKIMKVSESSKNISKILDEIDNLSKQTNILAINASIESARAGEAGRGFSVVANEIMKLSDQTKQATDKITKLIDYIQKDTDLAVETMGISERVIGEQTLKVHETESSFNHITKGVREVNKEVEYISDLNQNIAEKKDYIVKAIESISASSQQNSAGTQQVTASTEEILASTEELRNQSEGLESLVNEMKQEIKKYTTQKKAEKYEDFG